MVQPGEHDVVALAGRPAGLDQEARNDEQADALGAGGPPGILASTRWMMFSDSSWSPPEIHIFEPNSR